MSQVARYDTDSSRRRMGGPRTPPRFFMQKARQAGRRTGRNVKKSSRNWRPPTYPSNVPLGKLGAGGDIVVGDRIRERKVLYTKSKFLDSALKTWSFNGAAFWSSLIGRQRAISYPVLDSVMFAGMGTSDNTVDAPSEQCKIITARQGLEVTNTSNNTLVMKCYTVEASTDTPTDPVTLYGTALGDAGFSTDTQLATYLEPTKFPRFNRTYKVINIEEAVVGAGSMARFQHEYAPKRMISLSSFAATITSSAKVTRHMMLVWHGAPAKATTTTPVGDGATIGPSQIAVMFYGEINYKTSNTNQRIGYNLGRAVQTTTASLPQVMAEDADVPLPYTTA